MIKLMVFGKPGDEDFAPVPFLDAARICGVTGDQARKYLDRANVRQLLMAERRAWRAAISSGNEGALLRIRDRSPNAMAQLGAVRALEQLEENSPAGTHGQIQTPGLCIIIHVPEPLPSPSGPASSSLTIIDAHPTAGAVEQCDQAQIGPRLPDPYRA